MHDFDFFGIIPVAFEVEGGKDGMDNPYSSIITLLE